MTLTPPTTRTLPTEDPSSPRDIGRSVRSDGTQGIGPGQTHRPGMPDVDEHRLMPIAGYFPGPEGPPPSRSTR